MRPLGRSRVLPAALPLLLAACASAPPSSGSRPAWTGEPKRLPQAVRREIYERLRVISEEVDVLERREEEALTRADPQQSARELREIQAAFADIARRVNECLADPKYAIYRADPAYGADFANDEVRIIYYEAKWKDLARKAERADGAGSRPGSAPPR